MGVCTATTLKLNSLPRRNQTNSSLKQRLVAVQRGRDKESEREREKER